MTDITETPPTDEEVPPPVVAGLRRSRKVLWIAVAVAVPVFILVAVLASRQPAATRIAASPLVGKPAPAIEGTTVDGTPASLAELKGKWVVVNFFATWCVPCRVEHPQLIKFAEAHQAVGDAAVLGVVYSDNTQAVREYRDKEGGGWPMLTDPKGRVALDYGVAGIPESFLISPDGMVAAKLIGGVQAVRLDELLNQAKAGR
ncbi:MAG TPA: redoxin domain-containing protein [Acidimicrobiales bacterium]|nr:redoxin domain-containing protein [Acidimicrobiales bacterium]